ncbi:MAG TPA: 5-deoxy-glucuronate isomerase [Candidatus Acidoferrum sp.]|jgi:5-deoxy-glucuronate isomerase
MSARANLLIPARPNAGHSGTLMEFRPNRDGFEYVTFQVRRLKAGDSYEGATNSNELCIVGLGGKFQARTSQGNWDDVGVRPDVFSGMPYALYLSVNTQFTVTALTDCELAFCYSRAEEQHAAALITPKDVRIEIRGGANATRQINHILTPEFPAHRLLIVEVYTPGGNWSSYPPHKHDVHNPPGEVDLEELYYYRVSRPEGYAIQRVYSRDGKLDETITVRDGGLVLIPEGYHPVVAAHGYDIYYLNILAGSARSMAASDDPDYAWVRQSWTQQDERLPLVK